MVDSVDELDGDAPVDSVGLAVGQPQTVEPDEPDSEMRNLGGISSRFISSCPTGPSEFSAGRSATKITNAGRAVGLHFPATSQKT